MFHGPDKIKRLLLHLIIRCINNLVRCILRIFRTAQAMFQVNIRIPVVGMDVFALYFRQFPAKLGSPIRSSVFVAASFAFYRPGSKPDSVVKWSLFRTLDPCGEHINQFFAFSCESMAMRSAGLTSTVVVAYELVVSFFFSGVSFTTS